MKALFYSILSIVAVIMGCTKHEVAKQTKLKLDYYTESFRPSAIGVQPDLKVQYEYDASGNVSKYIVFGYNASLDTYDVQRSVVFTYSNGRVDNVEGFLAGVGAPYVQDVYQYLPDNRVSKIIENNYAAALTSQANFSYGLTDDSVKVSYTYSNGQGFDYVFSYKGKNIQADKTTRQAVLCSDGVYTYDTKTNPFNALGYVDYQLLNFSTNNRLTENVDYIDCAFPALEAYSSSYEYNEQGYPTAVTTSYKNTQTKSQRNFFYRAD